MTTYRRAKELGKVVRSLNEDGGTVCVDLFQRPDGTFGFEEYRRDSETQEGWFPIGFYSQTKFETLQNAIAEAKQNIDWLPHDL